MWRAFSLHSFQTRSASLRLKTIHSSISTKADVKKMNIFLTPNVKRRLAKKYYNKNNKITNYFKAQ